MRVVAWVVVLVAACGRFGFDGHSSGKSDARADDAPGADVRPADGAADLDAFVCPYELCDSFEADTFDPVWTPRPGASVDTGTAHGGAHSAHFQLSALTAGQMGYVQIGQSSTLPLGDTTFYVRAWVRLGSLPAAGNGMELMTAEQTGGANEDAVFVHTTTLDLYEQWTDSGQATTSPAPTGTWFCILWSVTRNTAATGSQTLDGDVGPSMLNNVPTDGTPAIDRMGFGIGFAGPNVSNPQPAMEVWIDDIVISSTPITCTQ